MFSFCTKLEAQEPYYWQLTEEDGLPSNTIYQVHQDKKGFMWFGTENGICRYDGKLIETYYHPDLLDNEILTLQEDKWGRIWFKNLAGQLGYVDDAIQIINPKDEEGELVEFVIIDSIFFRTYFSSKNENEKIYFIQNSINSDGNLIDRYHYPIGCFNSIRKLIIKGNKLFCFCIASSTERKILSFDLSNPLKQVFQNPISWNYDFIPSDFEVLDDNSIIINLDFNNYYYKLKKGKLEFQLRYDEKDYFNRNGRKLNLKKEPFEINQNSLILKKICKGFFIWKKIKPKSFCKNY